MLELLRLLAVFIPLAILIGIVVPLLVWRWRKSR